jgi:hypothetical protein
MEITTSEQRMMQQRSLSYPHKQFNLNRYGSCMVKDLYSEDEEKQLFLRGNGIEGGRVGVGVGAKHVLGYLREREGLS